MALKFCSALLMAGLMAVGSTVAMAQADSPSGNLGSNRSITAAPGTADSKAMSGVNTGDAGLRTNPSNYGGSAMNRTTPGATGKTIVPGDRSSQAGAAAGTAEQKTGTVTAK